MINRGHQSTMMTSPPRNLPLAAGLALDHASMPDDLPDSHPTGQHSAQEPPKEGLLERMEDETLGRRNQEGGGW